MRDALKTAIAHIGHMAAWIGKKNAGYSFEGLGEDMPGIQDAYARSLLPWRPIAELSEIDKYGNADGFLVLAPELVDLDCNVYGAGMGFWQDDGLLWHMSQEECDKRDREKDYGCWLACQWSMTNDEWSHVPCTPTHFLRITGAA